MNDRRQDVIDVARLLVDALLTGEKEQIDLAAEDLALALFQLDYALASTRGRNDGLPPQTRPAKLRPRLWAIRGWTRQTAASQGKAEE